MSHTLTYLLTLLFFLLTGWFPASGRLTYLTDISSNPPSTIADRHPHLHLQRRHGKLAD